MKWAEGGGVRAAEPAAAARLFRVLAMGLFVWRRRPLRAGEFTSGSALAPALIAVAVLSIAEVGVVDLLLAPWSAWAARILSAVALLGAVYLVGLAKSLRHVPTRVEADGLALRLGYLKALNVDYSAIRRVDHFPSGAPRAEGRLDLAPLSTPNIVIALDEEAGRGSPGAVRGIGVRMDDGPRFLAALEERRAAVAAGAERLRA